MATKALYVILDNRLLLTKKHYQTWEEIRDDYPDYKASLGAWTFDELIEYFTADYKLEEQFPFGLNRITDFYNSDKFILMELGSIEGLENLRWKSPWQNSDKSSSHNCKSELEKELHPEHILYGKAFEVIATRFDQDDIAIYLEEDKCVAFVHLTWSSKPESRKFPSTKICLNQNEFEQEIKVDNLE